MCLDDVRRPARSTYLVVLNDYLVAQDLAESIEYYDAQAEVIVRHTMAEATEALQFVETVVVAFVGEGPSRFAGSALAQMIQNRGGRVVLLGDEAEAEGRKAGWPVLDRPFSQSLVLTLLAPPV